MGGRLSLGVANKNKFNVPVFFLTKLVKDMNTYMVDMGMYVRVIYAAKYLEQKQETSVHAPSSRKSTPQILKLGII